MTISNDHNENPGLMEKIGANISSLTGKAKETIGGLVGSTYLKDDGIVQQVEAEKKLKHYNGEDYDSYDVRESIGLEEQNQGDLVKKGGEHDFDGVYGSGGGQGGIGNNTLGTNRGNGRIVGGKNQPAGENIGFGNTDNADTVYTDNSKEDIYDQGYEHGHVKDTVGKFEDDRDDKDIGINGGRLASGRNYQQPQQNWDRSNNSNVDPLSQTSVRDTDFGNNDLPNKDDGHGAAKDNGRLIGGINQPGGDASEGFTKKSSDFDTGYADNNPPDIYQDGCEHNHVKDVINKFENELGRDENDYPEENEVSQPNKVDKNYFSRDVDIPRPDDSLKTNPGSIESSQNMQPIEETPQEYYGLDDQQQPESNVDEYENGYQEDKDVHPARNEPIKDNIFQEGVNQQRPDNDSRQDDNFADDNNDGIAVVKGEIYEAQLNNGQQGTDTILIMNTEVFTSGVNDDESEQPQKQVRFDDGNANADNPEIDRAINQPLPDSTYEEAEDLNEDDIDNGPQEQPVEQQEPKIKIYDEEQQIEQCEPDARFYDEVDDGIDRGDVQGKVNQFENETDQDQVIVQGLMPGNENKTHGIAGVKGGFDRDATYGAEDKFEEQHAHASYKDVGDYDQVDVSVDQLKIDEGSAEEGDYDKDQTRSNPYGQEDEDIDRDTGRAPNDYVGLGTVNNQPSDFEQDPSNDQVYSGAGNGRTPNDYVGLNSHNKQPSGLVQDEPLSGKSYSGVDNYKQDQEDLDVYKYDDESQVEQNISSNTNVVGNENSKTATEHLILDKLPKLIKKMKSSDKNDFKDNRQCTPRDRQNLENRFSDLSAH